MQHDELKKKKVKGSLRELEEGDLRNFKDFGLFKEKNCGSLWGSFYTIMERTIPIEREIELLCSGAAKLVGYEELKERLSLGRPLRVKLGVDPTAPDIHLGHTVVLEKLRQFQELGHDVVLIIGDFTATVGDPTGRSATRPPLTREEVLVNAETYTSQAFKVLDRSKTEVVYNNDWFGKMTYAQVLKLNARVTLQQMLAREDFRSRVDEGKEVRLHELQYPVLQGWDSVEVRSDIELGGTDQLFNILVGRDMQKSEGMLPQIALCMPLLEGLDGVRKMSKSYGNYVGVAESPEEMFGKLMSVSDELMDRYYALLLGETRDMELHPMEAKKLLAQKITARYHDEESGIRARADWETRFSKRDLNAIELPEVSCADLPPDCTVIAAAAYVFRQVFGLEKSNSELRKQYLAPGAICLNDEKLTDAFAPFAPKSGDIFRLSKKHAVKFC